MAKLDITLSKEKFNELDPSIKEFYTATQDGNYELDGVGSIQRALEAEKKGRPDAVKAAVDKAVAEATVAALKPFEGIDIEAAKQAIIDKAKIEEEKLKTAGDLDGLKKQLQDRFDVDLKKKDDELEAVTREKGTILANLKREKLANVLTEKGVLPARVKFLVNELDSQIELVTDENGFSLKKVGGIGDAPEFETLITSLKTAPETEFFFAADNASGSGASGSNGNAGSGKTITRTQYDANPVAYAGELAKGALTITD